MKQRILWLLVLLFTLGGFVDEPPHLDPRGIYLNSFSGGFAGNEWFQVTAIDGSPGRYRIADIHGGGFDATIQHDKITLDGGRGDGRFENENRFAIAPVIGGQRFIFQAQRVALTTPAWPLSPTAAAVAGDPRLSGRWSSLTQNRDPVTGAASGGGEEKLTLVVDGSTMRITDPDGLYFQGVFIAPNRVVFRAIEPGRTARADYGTMPGSDINFAQDMLGEAIFDGPDRFTATFLLQSRTELGTQKQRLISFDARRTQ